MYVWLIICTGIIDRFDMLHPPTCATIRKRSRSATSGMYYIYPQGLSSFVHVHCDMRSKFRVGVTEIGHESESRTLVKGCEPRGCYRHEINYTIPMEQIVAIMKHSQYCEQFIKYECHASALLYRRRSEGWWVSRDGSRMNYWGGAAVDSGKCACGMTNNCDGQGNCNCNRNDKVWREDSGYLKDKKTLPVSELRFGDTGDPEESGYHTLGKLRCWG